MQTGENKYSKTSTNSWTLLAQLPLLDKFEEHDLATAIQAGLAATTKLANDAGLTAVEKRRLQRIAADGADARITLFEHNVRLGLSIARELRGGTLTEREQDAVQGVWKATEKFDPSKDTRFSTYATPWIRNYVTRGIRADRLIHVPEEVQLEWNRIRGFQSEFAQDYGREATHAEIAAGLGITAARVNEVMQANRHMVSLSVPRWDDGHTTLGDRILDESYVGLTGLETTLQAEELLGTASSHVDGVITVQVGDVIRSVDVEPLSRLLQFLQRGGRQ